MSPKYRGNKIGRAILKAVLSTVGRSCTNVILEATPVPPTTARWKAARPMLRGRPPCGGTGRASASSRPTATTWFDDMADAVDHCCLSSGPDLGGSPWWLRYKPTARGRVNPFGTPCRSAERVRSCGGRMFHCLREAKRATLTGAGRNSPKSASRLHALPCRFHLWCWWVYWLSAMTRCPRQSMGMLCCADYACLIAEGGGNDRGS